MAKFERTHEGADPGHGRRLSLREYEAGIVSLYENVPSHPDPATQKRLAAAELDLLIDHRLGVRFPISRRTELHRVHQRYQKRVGKQLLLFFSRWLLEHRQNRVATGLLRDFSSILTRKEFLALFNDAGAPD
ncbi:MAG: hypothetical protein JKY21_06060 [Alcanivorax sp.]|nr:hypothetical protein [Alcanivorax sp.]